MSFFSNLDLMPNLGDKLYGLLFVFAPLLLFFTVFYLSEKFKKKK